MNLYFKASGFMTSVQDGGRFGYQGIGVSPAGPMDKRAFSIANVLVGNCIDESAFEITYTGPEITFDCDAVIAITGANISPTLDSQIIPLYQAVSIKSGQTLKFGKLMSGLRCYLAIHGGLDIPLVMGSRSTLIRNNLGGLDGRAIRNGDAIALRSSQSVLRKMESRRFSEINTYSDTIEVRVIRGPQDARFTEKGLQTFFNNQYTVSNELDRMGCRFIGPPIEHVSDANIISDGIVTGSIQVPGHGTPIIMLSDRQTTGGYTKIATVISVDLPRLGQVKPGTMIRFIETDIKTAQKLYIKEWKLMKKLETKWRAR